jgi:4-hydroxybenzoate polyprenyltransferase
MHNTTHTPDPVVRNFAGCDPEQRGLAAMLADLFSLSRFHIVLIAAGGSLVFGWLLTGSFHPALACVVALDWFLVNIVNRVVDRTEDTANGIRGTQLAASRKRLLYGVAIALYVLSFSIHIFWRPMLALPRLLGHMLGWAYNFRLVPARKGRVRLKEVFFFKNAASCSGFLITLFIYPLAGYALRPEIAWFDILLLAAYFAPFELSFEVIYDLRDVIGDRAAHIASYPVVKGEEWSRRLIILLNVASVYALLMGATFGRFQLKECILVCGPLLQLLLFSIGFRRGFKPSDVVGITWTFASMNFIYCAWVLAGLPIVFPWEATMPRIVETGLVVCAIFFGFWLKDLYGSRRFLAAYALIMLAAWLGEQSSISLYQFYHYSPSWELFIGDVPIAVILIWPMVILTTHHAMHRFGFSGWAAVGFGALMVAFEATLIEVTCANAGLWHWEGRGLFGVPLIGILGWSAFAFGAFAALELVKCWKLALLPAASFFTAHAALQILWRGGMKYISFTEIPASVLIAGMCVVCVGLSTLALAKRRKLNLALMEITPRFLAAQLMYYLLFASFPSMPLLIFGLLFTPPYLLIANFDWVMPGVRGPKAL